MLQFRSRWRFLRISVTLLAAVQVQGQSSTGSTGSNSPASTPSSNTASVTAAPSVNNFQGYQVIDNTTIIRNCPSTATRAISGTYLGCCDITSTKCFFPTQCHGNSQVFDVAGVTDAGCPSHFTCHSMKVFPTSPVGNQSTTTNIFCASDWPNYPLYATLPTVTSTPVSTTTMITILSPTTVPSEPASQGKGWIAAAVIGPILAIAISILCFWCIMRRRKNRYQSDDGTTVIWYPTSPELGQGMNKVELDNSQWNGTKAELETESNRWTHSTIVPLSCRSPSPLEINPEDPAELMAEARAPEIEITLAEVR